MSHSKNMKDYKQYFKPIIATSKLPFNRKGEKMHAYEIQGLERMIRFMEDFKGFENKQGHGASMKTGDWSGTQTYNECLEVFKGKKKLDLIERGKEIMHEESTQEVPTHEFLFKENGLSIDVGKFMEGQPECFLDSEEFYQNEKTVDINLMGTYHSGTDPERIFKNMGRILKYLKVLEQQKIRTSITLWFPNYLYKKDGETVDGYMSNVKVPVKGYNEPFNMHKIACMFHPSYFRRGIFKFMETSGYIQRGYGSVPSLNREEKKKFFCLSDGLTEEEIINFIKKLQK